MKILWDGTAIDLKITGMVNYSLTIIEHIVNLYPDDEYYVILKPGFRGYYLLPKDVAIFEHRIPTIGVLREIKYLKLAGKITSDFDVFHCLTGNWPIALNSGICTFHDLRYFSRPESYYGLSCVKSFYLRSVFKKALKACDKIIAVSNATREDIIKYGNHEFRDDISVIHHGFNPCIHPLASEETLSKLNIRKPYILFVGELKKHKNTVGLVKSFNIFKDSYDKHDTQLVIVGKEYAGALRKIQKIGSRNINITGYISQEELMCLYHNASLFALLSFVEGFGFPLLEAMYHNLPIICSNIPSLSEVAGDAAIMVAPDNYEQIARTFAQTLNDEQLRKDLRRKTRQRLEAFKWETAARDTYGIYKEYLAKTSKKWKA
jgi:glycosyltransferase involved in cell wall biosynthesis